MVYCVSLALSLILIWIFNKNNKINIYLKAFICALPLSFVAGCRYNVGTDFMSYYIQFQLNNQGLDSRMEPLFLLLNKTIGIFTDNPQWFFIVTSFLFCTFFTVTILKFSRNVYMSMFLFLTTTTYFMFLNVTRQLFAISIAYLGFEFIVNKKFIPYIAVISVATLYHYSCILLIPLYWVDKLKLNRKYSILYGLLSIFVIAIIVDGVLDVFYNLSYYNKYIGTINNMSVWMYVGIVCCFFSFVFLEKKTVINKVLYICQLMLVCLAVFSYKIPLLHRIMWLYFPVNIIAIPNAIDRLNNRTIKIILNACIYVLFCCYCFGSIFINEAHDVKEYNFFFEK